MSTTITRIYAAREQADAAVSKLRALGIYLEEMNVVSGSQPAGSLAAAIGKGGVEAADASAWAAQLAQGGTLLTANARFTLAGKAIKAMDSCGPVVAGNVKGEQFNSLRVDATPLSSFLGLPLLSNNRTPFAAFWNLPQLSRSRTPLSSLFGLPQPRGANTVTPVTLIRSKSTLFGLPALTNNRTPLSTLLGLPTLSGR